MFTTGRFKGFEESVLWNQLYLFGIINSDLSWILGVKEVKTKSPLHVLKGILTKRQLLVACSELMHECALETDFNLFYCSLQIGHSIRNIVLLSVQLLRNWKRCAR